MPTDWMEIAIVRGHFGSPVVFGFVVQGVYMVRCYREEQLVYRIYFNRQ